LNANENRNETEIKNEILIDDKKSEKETELVLSKATMKLKNMLIKNNKSPIDNNDIISENNFPPLPNKSVFSDTRISGYENEKDCVVTKNYSSSGDNSTDREEGSISSDSSSPRYVFLYFVL
jgi:hypothetical protein